MKLSKLLVTRQALLRRTQLANLAYTYSVLQRFFGRIANANLHGRVQLRPANPADEQFWASLTALDGSQSVLEEHFADHELIELADAIAFAMGSDFDEITFRIEELGEQFLLPVRRALEDAGIEIDDEHTAPNLAGDSFASDAE